MAASFYPSPFEEAAGEVKEGFLCPLCLKDLQSFYQLQEHYEDEHSGEERHHIGGQLKSLVQKAKKATDKLWKRDGDERGDADAGAFESFYYGGVDPYMWEPQEPGATRSHLDSFKKQRAARIDHYVVEVNKLIIRLEKLTAFDRTNSDPAKIRAAEKSLVSWVKDSDVPFCPDCGSKFNIRNRRHHCRLCGSIMCRKCMDFVALPLAQKLIGGTREAPSVPGGHGQCHSPGASGPRRGSLSSLSSVTSAPDDKDDDKIRCCCHCTETLLKRERKMDEKDFVPDIVKLYQRLRMCMEKVDEKAPQYIRMAESLNAGETTYNLETAGGLRLEVQKYYELIDALSKKILTLGTKDEPQPRPKVLQLQRMVRYSATLFVQEKLLGLMSLPTKQKYEELKEKRKEEQERRLQQERLAAKEVPKRRQESEKKRPPADSDGEMAQAPPRLTKVSGWLPSSQPGLARGAPEDPLLQQIHNIRSFLRQAREARRADEVAVLEENLRQLRDEYERRQVGLAVALSRELADEEDAQRRPEAHEREESRRAAPAPPAGAPFHLVLAAGDLEPIEESSVAERDEESPPRRRNSGGRATPPSRDGCDDPVCREGSTPMEEDPSNPFCEDIRRECGKVTNGKKEYNPFDEDENEEDDARAGRVPGNPFEDDDDAESADPFAADSNAGSSTNPFDCDDADNVDSIEEELLLQQIDNIRAYIFDAKLSGRPDEVELLAENLRELQRALREQKRNQQ